VLHNVPSGTIHKLQRVQNNAARIIHQAPRRSHAYPLLKKITLVAGGAAHLLQAGLAEVQNTTDVSTGVPQSTHRSTQWNSVTEIIRCSTAPCAFQTDRHWQTIVQLHCTDNPELSACFCL